jgi:Zn finger protein HypA/HybF involved in hydrogenase expression
MNKCKVCKKKLIRKQKHSKYCRVCAKKIIKLRDRKKYELKNFVIYSVTTKKELFDEVLKEDEIWFDI